ncbi:MAG: DUF86 domain-containing protein [Anaerolineae bacterium]|nr:DUF86 domain-containing protein [Anaerolineae bacterium]
MRDDRERLLDIQEAIARIERHAARGRPTFEQDELIQNWMVSNIQVIGEACHALSPELRAHYPQIPWRAIVGMRNILVHHYFEIDTEAVWQVIERDLPSLKTAVAEMLNELEQ